MVAGVAAVVTTGAAAGTTAAAVAGGVARSARKDNHPYPSPGGAVAGLFAGSDFIANGAETLSSCWSRDSPIGLYSSLHNKKCGS